VSAWLWSLIPGIFGSIYARLTGAILAFYSRHMMRVWPIMIAHFRSLYKNSKLILIFVVSDSWNWLYFKWNITKLTVIVNYFAHFLKKCCVLIPWVHYSYSAMHSVVVVSAVFFYRIKPIYILYMMWLLLGNQSSAGCVDVSGIPVFQRKLVKPVHSLCEDGCDQSKFCNCVFTAVVAQC